MIVTILHRLEGAPVSTAANIFSDVPDGQWYTDAVIWAAEHMLGKLYLTSEDIPQDREQARYWFTLSANQGNIYAQFFLDHWEQMRSPSVMLSVTRLLHHMGRIFMDNAPPPSTAGMQTDKKLRQKIRQKKIAMGHKPDDHEEQTYTGPTMSM